MAKGSKPGYRQKFESGHRGMYQCWGPERKAATGARQVDDPRGQDGSSFVRGNGGGDRGSSY